MANPARENYSDERVGRISRELSRRILRAATATLDWAPVLSFLSQSFPGSMSSIHNQNFVSSRLNFLAVDNVDPQYAKSFFEYYGGINPWSRPWATAAPGRVLISERDFPIRLLHKTEFYADWVRPQKTIDASVGIKIEGQGHETIHLPIHYPLSLAERYDRAAAEVLRRIRANLVTAIEVARSLAHASQAAMAAAALVERADCAAFVVDGTRKLVEANARATSLFAAGGFARVARGRVSLVSPHADGAFGRAVAAFEAGQAPADRTVEVQTASGHWRATLAPLPGISVSLLASRPLTLALVRDMAARDGEPLDLSAAKRRFGLTEAELRLCRQLASGLSLAEAADACGISLGTVRQQSKAVFRKTGTHRQGELLAVLLGPRGLLP